MKKKLFIYTVLSVIFAANSVFADVLGTQTSTTVTDMGAYTYLHNVTFDSSSVGRQQEYYVEYTPNEEAVPVVINGSALWGTRTIKQAVNYMEDNGLRPLIGINADYFSYATGIPMGTSIMNGEITTAMEEYIDAVGFRADGTGFIRGLKLKTTLKHGENEANVGCINKWYTKDFTPIGILTDKFGDTTHTSSDCLFLVCGPSDKLSIGKTVTLTVEDKFEYNGDIAIPKGKIILLINKTGYENDYNFLNGINIGETLTVTNTAEDDAENIWASAENAIGTSAGRLLINGEVGSGFEAGAAPRTAVGIKPDGNVIFYVLDGRRKGYSYGAQAETIAKRLKELGCTDALNLDGGGSTAMAGIFPGSSEAAVVNSPSDGKLRSCANYLFLKDNRKRTDIPKYVVTDNVENKNFISGTSMKINVTALYDTSNYKMDGVDKVTLELSSDSGSYLDDTGVLHFEGTGPVTVNYMYDGASIYSEQYESFETPEDIKMYDESTWKEVSELYCGREGDYSINLLASPVVNGIELNTQDNAFNWSLVGDIGNIDANGVFTLSRGGDKAGKIVIEKGGFKKEINVYLADYNGETEDGFADISGHWARDIIIAMANEGILNGSEENSVMVFKPDNNMTRAEFTKMICSFEGIDENDYANETLNFTDNADIPQWAENAIKAMHASGIIKGRVSDDGTVAFAPYDNITRAEAMTILGRLLDDAESVKTNFADNGDIPQWAADGIGKLLNAGIITGYEDNTILPNNNIRRCEAAAMLYRINH